MKLLILLLLPFTALAQVGGYVQAGSETFYTKNLAFSAGVSYKEFRVGYYQQSAQIPYTGTYSRKGVQVEVSILNVDKIAYFIAGLRVVNANDSFINYLPYTGVSWRYKFVEVPITLSSFKGSTTAQIGVRVLFKK